jgi:Hemerythrin HHE cation binding domain
LNDVPDQETTVLGAVTPQGEAMFAELQWIHSVIRSDLEVVREMAADTAAGEPASGIQARLRTLAAASPLWQLRISCLHYCRFVHSHHHAESVLLFPELRRSDPALGPVVDKLQADHEHVSTLLDDVEAAARELGDDDSPAARGRLVAALGQLSTDLLAHLAYEEESIGGTLRTWTTWPYR